MKHILICLLIALGIFAFMGNRFSGGESPKRDNNIVMATHTNVQKQTAAKVGVLLNHADNADKVNFLKTLEKDLGHTAAVQTVDCAGSAEAQMRYFKKLLEDGNRFIFAEVFEPENVDGMIALAKEYGAALLLDGHTLTDQQLKAYPAVYTIGTSPSETIFSLANVIASYWATNEDQLDRRKNDEVFYYSMVSNEEFEDSDERKALEKEAADRGCELELVHDAITDYLNYNYEGELYDIYLSKAELILFTNSSDALKAYNYFHNPSIFSYGPPRIVFGVLSADDLAYSLFEEQKVLFVLGNGGSVMGRLAAKMITALANGEPLNYSNVGVMPSQNGRSFLCGDLLLRNIIEKPEKNS